MDSGFFVYSWGCFFMDASFFSFRKKENSFLICIDGGYKSVGESKGGYPGKLSYHEIPQHLFEEISTVNDILTFQICILFPVGE